MNNINCINKNCFGCFSCYNACPVNAITMVENEEGFKYPVINESCINCGLCKKVCPHLVNNFGNNKDPECYAFCADDEIRMQSASGGAFPIIAKYFIENNGYVAGAVYNTDNIEIEHIVSKNFEDIEKMKNSKFFQSNINDCYKKVKDFKNLYCIDIVCHGVPSPKVFQKYIREKIKDKNEKWLHTNFRDKFNGLWSKLTNYYYGFCPK